MNIKVLLSSSIIVYSGVFLNTLVTLSISNTVSVNVFGQYSFLLSIINVCVLLTSGGYPQFIVRIIKKNLTFNKIPKKFIIYPYLYSLLTYTVLLILFLIAFIAFNEIYNSSIIFYIFTIIFFKTIVIINCAFLQSYDKGVFGNFISTFLFSSVFISFFYFYNITNINDLLFYFLLSFFIIFLVSTYLTYITIQPALDKKIGNQVSKKYWYAEYKPFLIVASVAVLNVEVGNIILGLYGYSEDVAFYKILMLVLVFISIGTQAVNLIISPKIASAFIKDDLNSVQLIIKKTTRLSCIIFIPPILVLFFFTDYFVNLVFDEKYTNLAFYIKCIAIYQIIRYLLGPLSLVMNMSGYEKVTLRSQFLCLFTSIPLMLLISPLYGFSGVLYIFLLVMFIWSIYMLIKIKTICKLIIWLH